MGSTESTSEVLNLNKGWRRISTLARRHRRSAITACVIALATTALGFVAAGQPAGAKANLSLEQCANLDTVCDSAHASQWQNGNLNHNQARYAEGQSVPYRSVIEGLTAGSTYSMLIEWDTTQNGKHAIDYVTSFDRTITVADPCAAVTCGALSLLPIPADPNVTAAGVTPLAGQNFSAFGATFPSPGSVVSNTGNLCATATCTIPTNPAPFVLTGDYSGSSNTSTILYFTAQSPTVVIAWAGHIATRLNWGLDGSAVTISGSPYHMRLHDFGCSDASNCGSGNMDRSLESEAVIFASSVTVKKVSTRPGPESFAFTATPSPLVDFNLVDDNTAADTKVFDGITNFTTYTIAESQTTGWLLDSIQCSSTATNGGSQLVNNRSAIIDLREGEQVSCTFTNSPAPARSIDLTKLASPTQFSSAGDVVTYTYTVSNTGETTLGPTQFSITDNKIDGGTPFDCGTATAVLTSGATLSCTHDYTVLEADVTSGSIVNTATASGDGLTSPQRTATVTFSAPVTTTTTSTTTTTTTTTLPEVTTTLPEIITTLPVTSTTQSPTTTTTLPSSTTSTTTAPTTSTTTAATTTTAAPQLQVIGIAPTTTAPPESDFLVLFPNELPRTGRSVNWILIIGAALLLIIGSVVGFTNNRLNNRSNNKKGIIR